jgi:hypothetical protein
LTSLIIFLVAAGSSGSMATASRLLWSLARDNGVPYSRYVKRVSFPKLSCSLWYFSKTLKTEFYSKNRSTQ